MVVLIIEHVPTSLRGELTRWMLEPKAGVFVGRISAMVREKLWDYIRKKAPECGITMLYNARREQGFSIRSYGDTTRNVIELEGVSLIQRPKISETPNKQT